MGVYDSARIHGFLLKGCMEETLSVPPVYGAYDELTYRCSKSLTSAPNSTMVQLTELTDTVNHVPGNFLIVLI